MITRKFDISKRLEKIFWTVAFLPSRKMEHIGKISNIYDAVMRSLCRQMYAFSLNLT